MEMARHLKMKKKHRQKTTTSMVSFLRATGVLFLPFLMIAHVHITP